LYLCIFIDNFVKFICTFDIRTFFSLNIKNSSLIEKISGIQEKLKLDLKQYDIRWEQPSKFHLTLRFLGSIEDKTVQTLIEEAEKYDFGFSKIIFETKGIGFFPSQKFPNVVFLELTDKEESSQKLAELIERTVKKLGFDRDKRFTPHVTLGRFSKGNRKKIENIPEVSSAGFNIEMDSFCLMKSMMSNKGSEYFLIKKFFFNKAQSQISSGFPLSRE